MPGYKKVLMCQKCGNNIELIEFYEERKHILNKNMLEQSKSNDNFYKLGFNKLNKKTIEQIYKFIEKSNSVCTIEFSYYPYICKNCGKIESKLDFEIKNDKEAFTPAYVCECGSNYEKLSEEEKEHICCNKCGNEMTETNIIFWD